MERIPTAKATANKRLVMLEEASPEVLGQWMREGKVWEAGVHWTEVVYAGYFPSYNIYFKIGANFSSFVLHLEW